MAGASTAHALDIDAELARGIEHRRSYRKASALARWHEEDEGCKIGRGCGQAMLFRLRLGDLAFLRTRFAMGFKLAEAIFSLAAAIPARSPCEIAVLSAAICRPVSSADSMAESPPTSIFSAAWRCMARAASIGLPRIMDIIRAPKIHGDSAMIVPASARDDEGRFPLRRRRDTGVNPQPQAVQPCRRDGRSGRRLRRQKAGLQRQARHVRRACNPCRCGSRWRSSRRCR